MIIYPVPERIGIGISRGSSCCLLSITENGEELILDYSGRILNLANRLMNIARPYGLVIEYETGKNILSNDLLELFSEEEVYLKGVSEENPIKIYYLTGYVIIEDYNKKPLKEPSWESASVDTDYITYKKMVKTSVITLPMKPLNINDILIRIEFQPIINGELRTDFTRMISAKIDEEDIKYRKFGNKHEVIINHDKMIELLETAGIYEDAKLTITVYYSV